MSTLEQKDLMAMTVASLATKADLAEMKATFVKWMAAAFGAQMVVILSAVIALALGST